MGATCHGQQMRPGTLEVAENQKKAGKALRALLVEHSRDDIDLILRELKQSGFAVDYVVAENRDEFLASLTQNSFDAVLSDYRLPDWNGLDALSAMLGAGKDIPFILITGTLREEAAVECIKQGVSDYVLKDNLARLPLVLSRALTEKSLREENAHAQEALRISEARNRDLVENSVYGILRVTADGTFLDVNPAALRILGCANASELGSVNLASDVFRFPAHYLQLSAACGESGQVHGAEAEWRRRNGGLVTVRLDLRRICSPGGPDALEIVAEDETELRVMERQLRQAQKFEAVGQLAGGVAHDFNNVIGAILGWAELGLDQSRDNPAVAERFGKIRDQAARAAGLTRELLAFARRQVLQPRPTDLNSVAGSLVKFLDKVIGKDIEFKFINAPLDPVKADAAQIEQVLMNLCLNARDAMPNGGQMVIETEMVELDQSYCKFYAHLIPGRYAVISVSDTGVGMTPEVREHMFEPFYTTKERGKATGMGLAMAYGIVKQHGGFIHVYSEAGEGSLFRIYLPGMEAAVREVSAPKVPAPSVADMHGSETILLAEDHESIREMARQTLVNLGYRVLTAGDGEESVRLCQQEAPALAILDVVMPKLGGPATAARLAAQFARIRILFTSGYSADSSAVPAPGAHGRYLQKPYSPTTLGRVIREILDQAPPATKSAEGA